MAPSTAPVARPNNGAILVGFACLSAIGLWLMRLQPVVNKIPVGFTDFVESGILPNGTHLKKNFTGFKALDGGLSFLVAAFLYGPTGWNEPFYWLQLHFLPQITALIAVMTVEACRERNQSSWLKYTAVWAFVYQNIGGAVIITIWWLLLHRISGPKSYFSNGRAVPLPYARAILPGLILFYVVPTFALFIPGLSLDTLQSLLAFWQPSPLYVNIPLWIAPYFATSSASPASKSRNADLSHLKILYAFCFVLCVAVHWFTIYGISISPDPTVSYASVFVPSMYTWNKSMDWGLLWIFQMDWIVCAVASLLPAWIAVCDVQRLTHGEANIEHLLEGFIVIMAVTAGGGPGAALAATWYWREHKMAAIEARDVGKKAQ